MISPAPCKMLSNTPVVFASPSKTVAVVFSAKWSGRQFEFGSINQAIYLREKEKGAFERVFAGKRGYVHGVDHRYFKKDARLGMVHHEFISERTERVHRVETIEDVGAWLLAHPERIRVVFKK